MTTPNRELTLDVETTGMSWENGHKIIEIGIVELIDRKPTGNNLQVYINPMRDVDEGAQAVHGWDWESLEAASDGRTFDQIAKSVLNYIDGDDLVIHNAPFDMGFLDAEFKRCGMPPLTGQVKVIDTLMKANQMYPGRRNSLDHLSKRLGVDQRDRTMHGALLDSQILADVYLLMTTKQSNMTLDESDVRIDAATVRREKMRYDSVDPDIASRLPVINHADENEFSL